MPTRNNEIACLSYGGIGRSRTALLVSSPLVPCTTKVIARPFNRPKLANAVPAGASSVAIVRNGQENETLLLRNGDQPAWRWRIVRRGKPMGVRIEGGGFSSYHAARMDGSRALADFLNQLELEKKRAE